jgi:hypothetical protein
MDSRLVRVEENRENTIDGDQFGLPDYNESVSDITESLSGFALIGTKKSITGGDENIFVTRLRDNGEILGQKEFDFTTNDPLNEPGLNDQGNSISLTTDGGFILLGTVESGSVGNGRKDYWLVKINAIGEVQWKTNYGGPDDEEGASVRQTSDGYLIFGTTNFGNLKKLMLMKVDRNGEL